MSSPIIWFPTIYIPKLTPFVDLQNNGYTPYVRWEYTQPAGSTGRRANEDEIRLWMQDLGLAIKYAARGTATILTRDPVPEGSMIPALPAEDPSGADTPPPAPVTVPQTGILQIDAILQAVAGIIQAFNNMTGAIGNIGTVIGRIQGVIAAFMERVTNTAENVGAFVSWIDTPQTWERIAVTSLGVFIVLAGVTFLLISLIPGSTVKDIAKTAVEVAV